MYLGLNMNLLPVHVSAVIPAKNEAENIEPLVSEIIEQFGSRNDFEIIYVDDGSTDSTADKVLLLSLKYPGIVRLVQHDFSVGQSTAIHSGVSLAKGELIVTLDADGQNDPVDMLALINKGESFEKGADYCVAGYRRMRKDTQWKRLQSRIANKIRSRLLNDNTPDTGCGLKVFPKHTFLKLPYFDHMHRFLPALIKRQGGVIVVMEVSHRNRQFGQSKYGMWGRLSAGIIDMLGVIWLQRRAKLPNISEIYPNE
ncbi:glycosyl transferase, group 2 family protein [Paraglaciecola polaris LMG 21857]|uniref:Glycosyl transferase, group 2 family protein n=2 Tax=Paraglaciecola polaris TaxID=222814 RepID=K6ZZD8_9ALTE|nr:glycosyl transferase, group 2 family protein [Paraglaciecola polaris LMG 21857]|tara:strand:- start:10116 stop:10880 length:765 start_codon:yes stop_codon:yes gene_type:complete